MKKILLSFLLLISCNSNDNHEDDMAVVDKNAKAQQPKEIKMLFQPGDCITKKTLGQVEEDKEAWEKKENPAEYRIEAVGKKKYQLRSVITGDKEYYEPTASLIFEDEGQIKVACPDHMKKLALAKIYQPEELALFRVGDCLRSLNKTAEDVKVLALRKGEYTVSNSYFDDQSRGDIMGYTISIAKTDEKFVKTSCKNATRKEKSSLFGL